MLKIGFELPNNWLEELPKRDPPADGPVDELNILLEDCPKILFEGWVKMLLLELLPKLVNKLELGF